MSLCAGLILKISDLDWITYRQQNHSIVEDLFTGQQICVSICSTCHHVRISTQTFRILVIPIAQECIRASNGHVKLMDCLSKFNNIDQVRDFQCNYCNRRSNQVVLDCSPSRRLSPMPPITPNGSMDRGIPVDALSPIIRSPCNQYTSASMFETVNHRTSTPKETTATLLQPILTDALQRYWLREPPGCLIIQLCRFNFVNKVQSCRIKTRIDVPIDGLSISNLVFSYAAMCMPLQSEHILAGGSKYRLYALCLHSGGDCVPSGHYIAYAIADDGLWYKFEDENVVAVNIEYELSTQSLQEDVYLLFYHRQR